MDAKHEHQYPSMPKNYSLLSEIQKDPLYKSKVSYRDTQSRKILENLCSAAKPTKLLEGNLYMFHYYTPKTAEELEYYDAMPCTIVFGRFKSQNGSRILGFNLHYYPPKIRYQVMNKVMDIYKSSYQNVWSTGFSRDLSQIEYQNLVRSLEKANLGFGVHMYIPSLITKSQLVPPSLWHLASFSEGRFRKATREVIMKYWKRWKP